MRERKEKEGVEISEQKDRETLKSSRESIETRITSCKLDITAGLLVLKDLLKDKKSTEEQFKAQKVVEKLEKKLEVLMKLKNLASGSKEIENPLEFIE